MSAPARVSCEFLSSESCSECGTEFNFKNPTPPPTDLTGLCKRQNGTRARRSAKARDKVLQKVLETGTTSQSQGRRSRPGTDLRHESADLLFNTSSPLELVPLQDTRIQAQDSIESLAGGNGSRRDGDSSHRVMGVAVLRATVTVGYTACLSANEKTFTDFAMPRGRVSLSLTGRVEPGR